VDFVLPTVQDARTTHLATDACMKHVDQPHRFTADAQHRKRLKRLRFSPGHARDDDDDETSRLRNERKTQRPMNKVDYL